MMSSMQMLSVRVYLNKNGAKFERSVGKQTPERPAEIIINWLLIWKAAPRFKWEIRDSH